MVPAFRPDTPRILRVVGKIIRGLYYKLDGGNPLPRTHGVYVWPGNTFVHDPTVMNLVNKLGPPQSMGDETFGYRVGWLPAHPGYSAWLLRFYNSATFFCLTLPIGQLPQPDSSAPLP
jgi:hypothetical protein